MRSNFKTKYQQAAYIQAQRLVCLLLLAEYCKRITGPDGNYLIASKVSTFIATAADIYRNDKGIGSGTIASANSEVTVNLTIKVIPPHIVSIAPDNGETAVDPKTSVIVTFSEAVDKNTVTSSNIYIKDSSGNIITGVFSINPDGTEVTFYPSVLLKSEASYTVTVTKSIRDLQGYLMGQDVTTTFKIKDMTPPPMPPAGSITGTFPDADGYVTITATQGSAEANATVLVINDTTGEIVSVTPQCPISGHPGQLNGMKVLDDVCYVRWTLTWDIGEMKRGRPEMYV